jgi:NADH dehydrogenase
VGGGFGGLWAARALARAPVDVLLVDRRNHHVFSPLLYQVATAALSPGDIASPIRWVLRRQNNLKVWLAEAVAVDVPNRTLRLADGEVTYDHLILAAGSRPAYFGHDEWETHAPGLKTMEDAITIRRQVLVAFERAERDVIAPAKRLLTFVVISGGALAWSLQERWLKSPGTRWRRFPVDSPETARVIPSRAAPSVAAVPKLGLRATGGEARVIVDGRVQHRAGRVHLGGPRGRYRIWSAGVAAAPIGATLGVPLDRSGRVLVNPDLTIPGRDDVYVVGDMAVLAGADGSPLPGVSQVAMQEARWAAENIERTVRGESRKPFVYRDLGNMATIGRNSAVADLPWLRLRLKGYLAWWAWLMLHIYWLIGFRNRCPS